MENQATNPDAKLFARIKELKRLQREADRAWNKAVRLKRKVEGGSLFSAKVLKSLSDPVARERAKRAGDELGVDGAWDAMNEADRQQGMAMRALMKLRPRTLAGIEAKLRMTFHQHLPMLDHIDTEDTENLSAWNNTGRRWVEIVADDLARLLARGRP